MMRRDLMSRSSSPEKISEEHENGETTAIVHSLSEQNAGQLAL